MARRYQPVLLAARMQYRLRQMEAAMAQGDTTRASREAAELADTWSRYGYMAGEAGGRVQGALGEITACVGGWNPAALEGQIRALDGALRKLV